MVDEVVNRNVVKPHDSIALGSKFDIYAVEIPCIKVNSRSFFAVYLYVGLTGKHISLNVQILPHICGVVMKYIVAHGELAVLCFKGENSIFTAHKGNRNSVCLFGKQNKGLENNLARNGYKPL